MEMRVPAAVTGGCGCDVGGGGGGGGCCRGGGKPADGEEGKDDENKSAVKGWTMEQVVPVHDNASAEDDDEDDDDEDDDDEDDEEEAEAAPPYVMAVDDSSVDRAVITALLRRSKYRVTAVDSGKRALEILGSEPNVCMIITDYWMPEMTGYDLLKKIKSFGITKRNLQAGIVGAEADPGGDHVVRERAHQDQQMLGRRRGGLPAQARPTGGHLPHNQPDAAVKSTDRPPPPYSPEAISGVDGGHFLRDAS